MTAILAKTPFNGAFIVCYTSYFCITLMMKVVWVSFHEEDIAAPPAQARRLG